jgi:Flp pilus assembly pilin Flp
MVEYTLILALVVAGLIAGYTSLGTTCMHLFNEAITGAFGS